MKDIFCSYALWTLRSLFPNQPTKEPTNNQLHLAQYNVRSAIQDIIRLSQHARAHCIRCCLLPIPTIRWVNPERFVATHFLKPCCSIFLLSTGATSKRFFKFNFLCQHFVSSGACDCDFSLPSRSRITALFRVITQRVVVIPYRRFGTTCCFTITQKSAVLSGGCVCQPTFPPHCNCPLSD